MSGQKTIEIPWDVEELGGSAIEFYLMMLDKGESPSMAALLATRRTPGLNTDTSRTAAENQSRGGTTLADQFKGNENLLQYRIQQARKHGYNPSASDYYDSTRARFPGDPRAFTGSKQSLDDVKRDMLRTGDGMAKGNSTVVSQETDVAPTPPKKLAEDLVDEIQRQKIAEDPGLAFKDQRELRSQIKHEHGNNAKDAVE